VYHQQHYIDVSKNGGSTKKMWQLSWLNIDDNQFFLDDGCSYVQRHIKVGRIHLRNLAMSWNKLQFLPTVIHPVWASEDQSFPFLDDLALKVRAA